VRLRLQLPFTSVELVGGEARSVTCLEFGGMLGSDMEPARFLAMTRAIDDDDGSAPWTGQP
jgi:hypothetical protein